MIGVIVILVSLLLPAIQQSREQARRHQCRQNLAQIGIALRVYHDAHRCLPSGVVNSTGPVVSRSFEECMFTAGGTSSWGAYEDAEYEDGEDEDILEVDLSPEELADRAAEAKQFQEIRSEYLVSWIAQILPQLGQQTTYRQIDFQTPQLSFVSAAKKQTWQKEYERWTTTGDIQIPRFPEPEIMPLAILVCPSRANGIGYGAQVDTQYVGCYSSRAVPIDANNDGLLYLNSSESMDEIPDGAATTILAGEAANGLFRSYYYGDHSSLRATVGVALRTSISGSLAESWQDDPFADTDTDLSRDSRSLGFNSAHQVVAQFLFADGSVMPVSTMIDAEVFAKLGSRNDGSIISADQF